MRHKNFFKYPYCYTCGYLDACYHGFNPIQEQTFWSCSVMMLSEKTLALAKACNSYPTMIKIDTVIP